jgi:pimeloyl-ACP methyl ester carboxylesterase
LNHDATLLETLKAPFANAPPRRRPSRMLLGLEVRAIAEMASIPYAMPWLLYSAPQGDGHPVLIIPGMLASDHSSSPLRAFLRLCGYQAHGWNLGRNLGPRQGVMDSLQQALPRLHDYAEGKVSVIGWSLGGIFAREIARKAPQHVRQVITLGSPLYGDAETSTNAWKIYSRLAKKHNDHSEEYQRGDRAPPVPTTSIYSRSDGVVGWGCCVEHPGSHTENIEVNYASHIGLGVNPVVWYALADRLAQPDGEWAPFDPSGLERLLFRVAAPASGAFNRTNRKGKS